MKMLCVIAVLVCACGFSAAQTLERGDNEFGFWGGFSPKATTIFEGLREDEAEDRKFFLAAFRYGRTLAANDKLALQWTVDGDRTGSNRGLNQFVFYAGFSFFK